MKKGSDKEVAEDERNPPYEIDSVLSPQVGVHAALSQSLTRGSLHQEADSNPTQELDLTHAEHFNRQEADSNPIQELAQLLAGSQNNNSVSLQYRPLSPSSHPFYSHQLDSTYYPLQAVGSQIQQEHSQNTA
jgi:hypothetical protein